MKQGVYQSLQLRKKEGKKSFAVLIDPDKVNTSMLDELIDLSLVAKVDYFLVGGSLVISNHLDDVVHAFRSRYAGIVEVRLHQAIGVGGGLPVHV